MNKKYCGQAAPMMHSALTFAAPSKGMCSSSSGSSSLLSSSASGASSRLSHARNTPCAEPSAASFRHRTCAWQGAADECTYTRYMPNRRSATGAHEDQPWDARTCSRCHMAWCCSNDDTAPVVRTLCRSMCLCSDHAGPQLASSQSWSCAQQPSNAGIRMYRLQSPIIQVDRGLNCMRSFAVVIVTG